MTIRFEQTCFACPEQYDAYDKYDNLVGYLRLRHGFFYVSTPDRSVYLFEQSFPLRALEGLTDEETRLYLEESTIDPDGIFESTLQRETYLAIAERVIENHLNQDSTSLK